MKSYNHLLKDPSVFCFIKYDLYTEETTFVIVGKNANINESEDNKFFKWVNNIGNIKRITKSYIGEYKFIRIISEMSDIEIDEDVSLYRILNGEIFEDYKYEISKYIKRDINDIPKKEFEKYDGEVSRDVEEFSVLKSGDRIFLWNWEINESILRDYENDNYEDVASFKLDIDYNGKTIAFFKSNKYYKKNIFFSEFIRRDK